MPKEVVFHCSVSATAYKYNEPAEIPAEDWEAMSSDEQEEYVKEWAWDHLGIGWRAEVVDA